MSGRKFTSVVAAAVLASTGSALAVDPPKMGTPAPADLIQLMDINIPPDGTGLPAGQMTAWQAAGERSPRRSR